MRQLLIILAILTTGKVFACGGAYQLRLFPIGMTDNKIILIETSFHRYSGPDTSNETTSVRDRWRGTIKLSSLDKKGIYKQIQLVDSLDFPDFNYISEFKKSFKKAIASAQSIHNFVKADKQVIEFCNYKKSCKFLSIKADTTKNQLRVTTLDRKNISINFPEEIINESEAIGGISNQHFSINSIRKIKIGDINLTVVDFATGEENNTDFITQTKNQEKCSSPIDCIYPEIVLHHGISFDKIIWE